MLETLKKTIKEQLSEIPKEDSTKASFIINNEIIKESENNYLGMNTRLKFKEELLNELYGYGKIEKYLKDNTITEIMINGNKNIFIEKNGILIKEKEKIEVDELNAIVQKIVTDSNKIINISHPIVDANLKDGSRVNIVMKPIAIDGPIITIRKYSKNILTMDELIKNGTLNYEMEKFLKKIVKERKNIFVSGGTGSGKTTLLNILSNYINTGERVITIEDTIELKIKNIENLINLETRDNFYDSTSKIEIRDLIITSLRMRPDRIIVGEVRGKETFDMLQAMNTGHSGSMSTGHANSPRDMLTRLESMMIMNFDIPLIAIKRQIASAIDYIVHVERKKDGKRKIVEICSLDGIEKEDYIIRTIFNYDEENNMFKKICKEEI